MELLRCRAKPDGKDGGLDIGPTQVSVPVFGLKTHLQIFLSDAYFNLIQKSVGWIKKNEYGKMPLTVRNVIGGL